jgi:hypothetical protein
MAISSQVVRALRRGAGIKFHFPQEYLGGGV